MSLLQTDAAIRSGAVPLGRRAGRSIVHTAAILVLGTAGLGLGAVGGLVVLLASGLVSPC